MVNSVDPGYCATDQNNNQGFISAEQGAVTAALLAHAQFEGQGQGEAPDGGHVSGRHFYEGREVNWQFPEVEGIAP